MAWGTGAVNDAATQAMMTPTGRVPMAGMADILADRAAAHPDREAFVFLAHKCDVADSLSYGALNRRVEDVAAAIAGNDLIGRTVLLMFEPGLDFVVAFFACLRAGAVAVPMPVAVGRRTEDRVSAICRDAAPYGILTLSRHALPDAATSVQRHGRTASRINLDTVAAAPAASSFDRPGRDDLALLQYTSGSTSAPKGVMLTHGNLVANNAMIAAAFGHDASLRGVGWLPLFHDMGLIGHVLQPVYVGGLSVLMSPLTFLQRPIRWLEAVSHWRATTSGAPSYGYSMCLRQRGEIPQGLDFSAWRVAYCGSEPIRGAVLDAFSDRFSPHGFDANAFLPCYGLAESTLLATSRPNGKGVVLAGADRRHAVSCGHPWKGGEISIEDADTGQEVADGTVGEIRVAGPHVGLGYWGMKQGSGAFRMENGGRSVRTGDRGYRDGGELYVLGRSKDVIIIMGVNHAAEDIEGAALGAHPLFEGQIAAAFGIDGEEGERVVIVHEVPGNAAVDGRREAASAVTTAVVRQLGVNPADVALVKAGTLPRTSSGKIQRSRVRHLYVEGGLRRLETSASDAAGNVAP